MRRLRVAVVVLIAWALFAPDASAYCRTTTCDRADGDACREDPDTGCITGGAPAHWEKRPIPYRFAKGTPKNVREAFERAALTWMGAHCDATALARGGRTSLLLGRLDDASDEDAEFVISVDDGVSRGTELGLTTLDFGGTTGTVKSARMRIDGTAIDGEFDLDTIFLHEIGHYIGLAHSERSDSVMQASYGSIPRGRKLGDDDELAVCVLYPPEPLSQLPPSCSSSNIIDTEPTAPLCVVTGWVVVTVARRRRRVRLPAAR